jgi:FMN phosphatase YigB (HAD superfamily)
MPQSLAEYADWLDNRDLIWPKLPEREKPKATPFLAPLTGIRAVTWSIYGTLLRIADGKLLHRHPQEFQMKVALEKTIEEFRMWPSMSRKPGAPWEYMLTQYAGVLERQQMRATKHKGDFPQINSATIWRTLIGRLVKNEYTWDESMYGDLNELSVKVAYFFHRGLQAVEAADHALPALASLSQANLTQGLLADAQPFTMVQMLRALQGRGTLSPPGSLFDPGCLTLSYQLDVCKPSKSLYRHALRQLTDLGIAPHEVLHVGSRQGDDLAAAKRHGMRTALYAGDAPSLQATKDELQQPDTKPDRLLTDLGQVSQVVGIC